MKICEIMTDMYIMLRFVRRKR